MFEYIKREDLMERVGRWQLNTREAIAEMIMSVPSADVRPVVLCKDCKYAERTGMADGCVWCNENLLGRLDDDFCSRGEKREES